MPDSLISTTAEDKLAGIKATMTDVQIVAGMDLVKEDLGAIADGIGLRSIDNVLNMYPKDALVFLATTNTGEQRVVRIGAITPANVYAAFRATGFPLPQPLEFPDVQTNLPFQVTPLMPGITVRDAADNKRLAGLRYDRTITQIASLLSYAHRAEIPGLTPPPEQIVALTSAHRDVLRAFTTLSRADKIMTAIDSLQDRQWPSVWLHGEIVPENILVSDKKNASGVICFLDLRAFPGPPHADLTQLITRFDLVGRLTREKEISARLQNIFSAYEPPPDVTISNRDLYAFALAEMVDLTVRSLAEHDVTEHEARADVKMMEELVLGYFEPIQEKRGPKNLPVLVGARLL